MTSVKPQHPRPQFPQVLHSNPKFLSQGQEGDGCKNLSLQAYEKRWHPLVQGAQEPSPPIQNETPTRQPAAVTLS